MPPLVFAGQHVASGYDGTASHSRTMGRLRGCLVQYPERLAGVVAEEEPFVELREEYVDCS